MYTIVFGGVKAMSEEFRKQRIKGIVVAVVYFGLLILASVLAIHNNRASSGEGSPASGYTDAEQKLADQVFSIVSPYYEASVETSFMGNQTGRYYTDHKSGHAKMVAEKSIEVGDTIRQAVKKGVLGKDSSEGHVPFSADVDRRILIGSGLSHDIGMCGDGYMLIELKGDDGKILKDENGNKLYEMTDDGLYAMQIIDKTVFGDVRSSHSMNSALIMMINRDAYKAVGYSDEEIDRMAIECMAHSKSNSGVGNLNSVESWKDCFLRLDSLVAAYNADHADAPIRFDHAPFENDIQKLGVIASETLSLRVGDVSRDSWPEAEAQSGEPVYVDRATFDDHGGTIPDEVENAVVTIGENHDPVESEKDKQVHAGEQNITDNHTILTEDGKVLHVITVNDGCSAPRCTQQAIDDHLGEFSSAKDEVFTVSVEFSHFDAADADFFRNSYEEFRMQAAQDYANVTVIYPWDE